MVVRDPRKSQAWGTWWPGEGPSHHTCFRTVVSDAFAEGDALEFRLCMGTTWKLFCLPVLASLPLQWCGVCQRASAAVTLGQESSALCSLNPPAEGSWVNGAQGRHLFLPSHSVDRYGPVLPSHARNLIGSVWCDSAV